MTKLTEADVVELRQRRRDGWPVAALARHYGMTQGNVSTIVHRKSWKHI